MSQGQQQLERVTNVKETEGRARRPPGEDLWHKGEDKDSVGLEEEGRDLEGGELCKLQIDLHLLPLILKQLGDNAQIN